MNAQKAFERYCYDKGINLTKRADGKYLMKSVRAAFAQFKEIYEIGWRDCALQEIADFGQLQGDS